MLNHPAIESIKVRLSTRKGDHLSIYPLVDLPFHCPGQPLVSIT